MRRAWLLSIEAVARHKRSTCLSLLSYHADYRRPRLPATDSPTALSAQQTTSAAASAANSGRPL